MDVNIGSPRDAAPPSAADCISRARALKPLIEAAGPRIEAERELPADVLDAMHGAGLFRVLLPYEMGGAQLDPAGAMQVVEAIAQADGSAGWCLGQGLGCSLTAACLEPDAAWQIFQDPRAVIAWGPGPSGKAIAAPGGWRISGRWGFASGSRHATWMGGLCPLADPDGTLRQGEDGLPVIRSFVFPKREAQIVDDWQVLGLRGTGSDSYSVSDLFVPDRFCFQRTLPGRHPGASYRFSLMHVYPACFGGVALGLARAIMDGLTALARGKTPRGAARPMHENAAIQSLVGQGEARLRAARMFLLQSLRDIFAELQAGASVTADHEVTIRMASTFAIHESATVADMAYHEAGASAIFVANPFERRFRDLHAVAQQMQGRRSNFELVGQRLLGLPGAPMFI
jgi:alkylation response protein AidB-like acyl-CoA dehydrogenase